VLYVGPGLAAGTANNYVEVRGSSHRPVRWLHETTDRTATPARRGGACARSLSPALHERRCRYRVQVDGRFGRPRGEVQPLRVGHHVCWFLRCNDHGLVSHAPPAPPGPPVHLRLPSRRAGEWPPLSGAVPAWTPVPAAVAVLSTHGPGGHVRCRWSPWFAQWGFYLHSVIR